MARSYSKDLREKIVQAYESGKGTLAEISNQFSVGKSTLSKYIKQFRETGDLTPLKSPGRPSLLDKSLKNKLKKIVLDDPDARLKDYCFKLEKMTGVKIKKSTAWKACNDMNIRRKKRAFTPAKENQCE